MGRHRYPHDILKQATDVIAACAQIDPKLDFGGAGPDKLSTMLTNTQSLQNQLNALEKQLFDIRSQRAEQFEQMWDMVKRVRSSVKGRYGDRSTEYAMVRGTSTRRRSPRKPQS